jgi:hypothetical protein
MIVERLTGVVEAVVIKDIQGLDPIHVYWVDVVPGVGYCTITCYGAAWTCYFGAMGGRSIKQFFAAADVSYLANAMSHKPHLKEQMKHLVYLKKIVQAVKESAVQSIAETS